MGRTGVDPRLLCAMGVDGGRVARNASGRGAGIFVRAPRGGFFSLGGVLALYAGPSGSLAPWLLSSAALVALASWDPLARGAPFDITLLGLAAYELLIALTRPEAAEPRLSDQRMSGPVSPMARVR